MVQSNIDEQKKSDWIDSKNGLIDLIPHKKNNGNIVYEEKVNERKAVELLIKTFHIKTYGQIKNMIYYYSEGYYKPFGHQIIAHSLQKWTQGIIKKNTVNEIIASIERETYGGLKITGIDNPHLICLANGILNIKTNELISHTPNIIFLQKIPIQYNENATCPKIEKFLSEILPPEDIITLQEYVGYMLYRVYNFKKACILIGERDTGKTTLLKLIISLVGKDNISGEALHSITNDKFSAINLKDKLLNYYDDLPYVGIRDTGTFKILTGNGEISGEQKFGERTQFCNYAKLLFATNMVSEIKDYDEAYYNRWLPLIFKKRFDTTNPATNKYLINELTETSELEGFLVWAIKGLQRLLQQGHFSVEKTAKEVQSIMENYGDNLSTFFNTALIQDTGQWISKDDLYFVYTKFMEDKNKSIVTKEKFCRNIIHKCSFATESQKDCLEKRGVYGWLNIGFNTSFIPFLETIYTIDNPIHIPDNDSFSLIRVHRKNGIKGMNNNYSSSNEKKDMKDMSNNITISEEDID